MDSRSWETDALDFYYHGLYGALKRFRAFALLGWGVVVASAAVLYLGRDLVRPASWFVPLLCAGAAASGIALVQAGIAGLTAYVRIPWPWPEDDGSPREHLRALKEVMEAVDRGGWREASTALDALEKIGRDAGLPPPGARGPGPS
jgi:hypothetical protein